MSDLTDAADSMAAEEPKAPSMAEAQAAEQGDEAESTTPEEVAKTLRSSGINIDESEATANAADAEEEGDETAGDDADSGESAGEDEATGADAEEETADEGDEADTGDEDKEVALTGRDDSKYSFTVEDANGKTFKITAGDDLEKALEDFELKSNGQALSILNQFNKLEAQKASDDQVEKENTAKAEQAQRVSALRESWNAEIKDLTAQDRIPKGDDGTARVNAVYKFMSEENDKRITAGRPTIGSFEDALDKLENKEARDKVVADVKKDKEEARKKGALVGGSSAAASTSTPVYRANSARNSNEALKSMGLL